MDNRGYWSVSADERRICSSLNINKNAETRDSWRTYAISIIKLYQLARRTGMQVAIDYRCAVPTCNVVVGYDTSTIR